MFWKNDVPSGSRWRNYFLRAVKELSLRTPQDMYTASQDGHGVVVSLTSYGARLKKLNITIESIFRQSLPPKKIILWISSLEHSKSDIPRALIAMERRGLEIRFIDYNLRCFNKLVPSLQTNFNETYVTADDDIIYPRWWLQKLVEFASQNFGSVVAYRGNHIVVGAGGAVEPYAKWPRNCVTDNPGRDFFPTGVSGVLYPEGCFPAEVLNIDAINRLTPTNDDVWFKAMTLLNGVPSRRVLDQSLHFFVAKGSQKSGALQAVNVHGQKNDEYMMNVFSEYSLSKLWNQTP